MPVIFKLLRFMAVFAGLIITIFLGFRIAAMFRETETAEASAPANGRFVATTQGRIFVTETGSSSDRPVLLIHGSGAWGGLWSETAMALAQKGYRSIALDLPPFGFSDRPASEDYSRTAQARRILALVTAMKLDRPIIVGHSFGGGPALEAVMRSPQTFSRVVLVDPALGIDVPVTDLPFVLRTQAAREVAISSAVTNPLLTRKMLASLIYRKDRAGPPYVDILQRPLHRSGSTAAIAAWLPALLQTDPNAVSAHSANYRRLTVSMSIIWGSKDSVTPLNQMRQLKSLVPASSVTILPDTGHIPQVEDPIAFQRALTEAIKK